MEELHELFRKVVEKFMEKVIKKSYAECYPENLCRKLSRIVMQNAI